MANHHPTKIRTMKLKELRKEITERMMEAMVEAIEYGDTDACCTVDTDAGYLDIYTNEDKEAVCKVSHDHSNKTSINIEEWVESIVPDWDEAVDEVDFRNGRDDDNCGLDPAFSSWEEVNAMFFRR